MTIAEKTTSARNDYIGNGARTEFPFTFEVLNEANSSTGKNYTLKVLVNDVEKTEDTDYTVSYDSSTRLGSITFTTAPASSAVITLLSQIALTQSTDYINIGTGAFPADSHEGTVDKLTLIARELDEKIDRSILLPESSTLSNVTIPVSTANASKFITVNGDGDNLTASEIADTVGSPVSTYMKTVLDDETAAAARTTLDAQQDVITTRGDIIRGSSAGVVERLALGASGQNLTSNGTDIAWSGDLKINNKLNLNSNAATIATGAVTYSGAYMVIDTEGAASTDDLDTISGANDGDIAILQISDSSRNVVLKHGTGNLNLINNQDVTLDTVTDKIVLMFRGSSWDQLSRTLTSDFTSSKSTNGYTYLPNGLILQWGMVNNLAPNTSTNVTLPVTYPNAQLNVGATLGVDNAGQESAAFALIQSTSQIRVTNADATTSNVFWTSKGH